MASTLHHRRSANEKNIEELQDDTSRWEDLFQINTEEIRFLKNFLSSDIFEGNIPNLYERLQDFFMEVEKLKAEKIDLHEQLRNHKNDLNGMMECEDISCETFYYTQHQNLSDRIEKHLEKVQELKMKIIRFSTPLLKKNSN